MSDDATVTPAGKWRPSRRQIIVAVLGSIALAVAALIGGLKGDPPKRLDGQALGDDLGQMLESRIKSISGETVHLAVVCPQDPLMKKDYIFDCSMAGYPDSSISHVRVTEDDDLGHYHYEVY